MNNILSALNRIACADLTHDEWVRVGMALKADSGVCEEEPLVEMAVRYAADLAGQDAEKQIAESLAEPKTNGGKALKAYGTRGAMGEAADGFPGALYCASRLRQYMKEGIEKRKAGALAFCDSMARLEDTNLLHRGGLDGLDFARSEASRIAAAGEYDERISGLEALDAEMIRRNLSPGGSADMLALAFFLERLKAARF